jgi:F0F1-type ATP synthase epsilon subunit
LIKGTRLFFLSLTRPLIPLYLILTHNKQDIAVVEAAKLEDIDLEEIPKIYAEAMKDFNAAPEGSKARVEAQIEVEVAKSLAGALGVVLV